ncbi:PAS domain S-box protein [Candidatus Microgenomates bacterium]|nr:PAS domain S-box protein [Candidatus Microgenomates bacterium]
MQMILNTARRKSSPTRHRKFGYTDPAKVRLFQLLARVAAALIILVGILVIVGWYLDIPRLRSFALSYPSMRVSTAIAFIAAGIYILLSVRPSANGIARIVYSVLRTITASVVLALGLIRLIAYFAGFNFDFDAVFLGFPPAFDASGTDHSIPNTPFFFTALGVAMVFYDFKIKRVYYSQLLILIAALVTMPLAISYIYQINLVGSTSFSAALPTLLCYALLIMGLLFARPTRQVMDIFTKDSAGGFLVRRLIIFAIILPLLVGWIILLGFRMGLYNNDFRYLLVVNSLIAIFILLIWENAQSLHASDIEQRETELELLDSQKKFSALAESNVIGVVLADLDGFIYEANDAFLHMLNYSRLDLAGKGLNWHELTAPELRKLVATKNRLLMRRGKVEQYEKEFIRKDKSRVPVIVGKTLLNREQRLFIAFVLDITERKRLEERKDEFISIASHELKTPLTSIKGYTQILERVVAASDNKAAGALLAKTNNYIDRLSGLIADLLDVSKIQSGKILFDFTEFNAYELVKESIEGIQNTAEQHKILLKHPVHIRMRGDRFRLEQVLHNLLTNAIKYSPRSNKVVVTMAKSDRFVRISVQDFGIGIPAKYQTKLFNRFYRVESAAKEFSGLGIGLFISSEIVKRHNGKINVESIEGRGSIFTVELPIAGPIRTKI